MLLKLCKSAKCWKKICARTNIHEARTHGTPFRCAEGKGESNYDILLRTNGNVKRVEKRPVEMLVAYFCPLSHGPTIFMSSAKDRFSRFKRSFFTHLRSQLRSDVRGWTRPTVGPLSSDCVHGIVPNVGLLLEMLPGRDGIWLFVMFFNVSTPMSQQLIDR